jgi:hypothetical protein
MLHAGSLPWLRILKHTDLVASDKRLAAYVGRCTARPAFKRAFDAQVGPPEGIQTSLLPRVRIPFLCVPQPL